MGTPPRLGTGQEPVGRTNIITESYGVAVPVPPAGLAVPPPGHRGPWGKVALFAVFWLVPVAWVGLTPPMMPPEHPLQHTRRVLDEDNAVMHAYLGRYKKTPPDLNALRAFARAEKLRFDPYDAFGQRLDYLRLDDGHYLLRSFGDDQAQNTAASAPNIGVVHWGKRPEKGLVYRYPDRPTPSFYPAVLLAGADSPDGRWLARLFSDPTNRTRELVIRHRRRAGLFMVAHHDAVEEFLWLPGGHQLVYTATASTRHRDGVYLWNLDDDSVVNLIDSAQRSMPFSPSRGGENLWLSLAGIAKKGSTVLFYAHPRHDGGLDPADFFVDKQLVAIQLPERPGAPAKLVPPESVADLAPGSPLTRPLDLGGQIDGVSGLKGQVAWLRLPVSGDLETILTAWQQYGERASSSPLYPYALWTLTALYGESFLAHGKAGGKEADVLRTYGSEVAKALLNDPLAPSYLKGLALYTYENLMDGQPLPYRFLKGAPPK